MAWYKSLRNTAHRVYFIPQSGYTPDKSQMRGNEYTKGKETIA
jgi:hypothetical protein